jgi:hypothetical protein
MTDSIIFGQLITPIKPIKFKTTIAKPCKSFEVWVRYMQLKERIKIQLQNNL